MANEFIARKGLIVLSNGATITGSVNSQGNINASGFSVSASAFTGSFVGDGSNLTGVATILAFTGSTGGTDIVNLKTEGLTFSGSSNLTATVTNNTVTYALNGIATTGSNTFVGNQFIQGTVSASSFSGSFFGNAAGLTGVSASALNNALTFGSGLSGSSFNGSVPVTIAMDTGSTHFITGSVNAMNLRGVFSSSVQTDVRNTTGIATIATTGSNAFTGVQNITNNTNSTLPSNGALVVVGGLGVGGNANISGSLSVVGTLTVATMSFQYVTSSQLNVSDNKITVQTNDLTRFGGLSVFDSGSTAATASIYWDSQNHNFIYENISGLGYNSALFIAGPQNTGALGNEVGLTVNRIPVASGTEHIDSRPESSSIRVDFPSRLTHVEAGLNVTGSVSSSVGFWGDGSNLTGLVTTLNVTGSQSGQGSINLRTQALIVSGVNGIGATFSGQTLTVSGANATTTTRGVASFNATNFTVNSGSVVSNPITFNGANINLGGTHAFGLQNITPYGASTTDQVTFSGGAIISGILHSSATVSSIVGPITNQVIATIVTGSYDAARFEYVVKDGTNFRTGTIMAVWRAGAVEHTDTSTNDIGNTAQATFDVDTTTTGNARLRFSATSNTWTVKTRVVVI